MKKLLVELLEFNLISSNQYMKTVEYPWQILHMLFSLFGLKRCILIALTICLPKQILFTAN